MLMLLQSSISSGFAADSRVSIPQDRAFAPAPDYDGNAALMEASMRANGLNVHYDRVAKNDDENAKLRQQLRAEVANLEMEIQADNPPDIREFGFTGNETKEPDLMDPRGIAFDLELIRRAEARFPGFPNVEEPKNFSCTFSNGKAALHRRKLRTKIRKDRQKELERWEQKVKEVAEGVRTDDVVSFFWAYESEALADVQKCLRSGNVAEARRRYRLLQDKIRSYDEQALIIISRSEAGPVSTELARRVRGVMDGKPDGKIKVKTKGGKIAMDCYLLEGVTAGEFHSRVKISFGSSGK